MSVRCKLGLHKWGEWREVDNHLEKKCQRCGKVEAKYPPIETVIVKCACSILKKYIELKRR